MDFATAKARLQRLSQAESDPVLTPFEVEDALNAARIADTNGNPITNVISAPAWTATATLVGGSVVQGGGRWWTVYRGGLTGTGEPTWPDLRLYAATTWTYIYDGSVIWQDAGGAWIETWDLAAAAADLWTTKAGKAAGQFDFTTGDQQFSRGQKIAHCQQMADSFRRRRSATLTFNSPTPAYSAWPVL